MNYAAAKADMWLCLGTMFTNTGEQQARLHSGQCRGSGGYIK